MRLGRGDLTRRRPKENGDCQGHAATDENEPRPGDIWPPPWHEPPEIPRRGHEASVKKGPEVERRNTHFAEDEHRRDAEDHRDDVRPVGAACAGDHSEKKYSDQRAVGVTKNADRDRDDG